MTTVGSDSSQTVATARSFKFREAVLSDVGLRRNENQDAFSIVHTSGTSLYLVADGMGGARGGATASSIAVNVISKHAFRDSGSISRASLKEAIERANAAIYQRSKRDEDLAGMGTTVVALAFVKDVAILAHVGDSRIYHIRVDTVRQLTRDHTLVQELVDSGAIPLEEAESHPIAHMLTRSLGPAESVDVEIQALGETLESGDKFLLCSDGLYNLVNEQEILREISSKSPEDATRALINLALERGGTDNVTVQIVEVVKSNDDSFTVEYPSNGDLKAAKLQGVEFGGLERLMDELKEFEQQQAAIREQSGHANSEAQDADGNARGLDVVEEIGADLPVDSLAAPLPQVDSEIASDRVRLQLGMLFVVGLTIGVLALSIYQLRNYGGESMPSLPEGAVPLNESQREKLDQELEHFATNESGNPAAIAPVTNELPQLPEIAKPETQAPLENQALDEGATLFADYVAQLQVGPPPRVVLGNLREAEELTRPIVWEHEAKRVDRLMAKINADKLGDAGSDAAGSDPNSSVSIFSEDELYAMVGEKEKVRERIGDLDSKLELLMIESREGAEKEFEAVGASVDGIRQVIEQKRTQVDDLKSDVAQWQSYKTEASGKRAMELISKLGALTDEIQIKKAEFDIASRSYFEAVDRWEKNPSDLTLASEMGALGRKLQSMRNEFEQGVKKSIDSTLKRTVRSVVIAEIELSYLEQTVARLSRKEGFLKGFVPFSPERKATLRDAFLNERNALVSRFNELQTKISPEEEINFRRRWLEREFNSSKQLASRR